MSKKLIRRPSAIERFEVPGPIREPRPDATPERPTRRPAGDSYTEGHQVDEELVQMARNSARREDPDNGFVSATHEHDVTLEVDRIILYAWGESARILAEKLEMSPKNPTRRLTPPTLYDADEK